MFQSAYSKLCAFLDLVIIRRWLILPIVLTMGSVWLVSCSSENRPQLSILPNIIILLADDMGYSDIGCMGSEIKTPNLDKLAEEGVLMTNFYTTARCCPSRASLLTGQYAHRAGIGHMNYDWEFPAYRGHLNKKHDYYCRSTWSEWI